MRPTDRTLRDVVASPLVDRVTRSAPKPLAIGSSNRLQVGVCPAQRGFSEIWSRTRFSQGPWVQIPTPRRLFDGLPSPNPEGSARLRRAPVNDSGGVEGRPNRASHLNHQTVRHTAQGLGVPRPAQAWTASDREVSLAFLVLREAYQCCDCRSGA